MSSSLSEFGYVLALLAHRLAPFSASGQDDETRRQEGVVFLLGAGCSRQYGLPDFRELLGYLWEDFFDRPLDPTWSFETLRDRLDKPWQAQGPESRQKILSSYLKQVDGQSCPGYVRLARLAKDRRIKAVVNMNFDTLCEDALLHEFEGSDRSFKISTTFRIASERHLMVYKPHGSLGQSVAGEAISGLVEAADALIRMSQDASGHAHGFRETESILSQMRTEQARIVADRYWVAEDVLEEIKLLLSACEAFKESLHSRQRLDTVRQMRQSRERLVRLGSHARIENDLILDIANSDLFSDPEEQMSAQELLTANDVVTIGYSGVDAKIAAALRSFSRGQDPRDRKLFVVNVTRPDPRIVLVMAERASHDLSIVGEEAAFENFMEHLDREVRAKRERGYGDSPPEDLNLMTRAEKIALRECLKLALSIRSSINVADRSSVGIEEHGKQVYEICLRLAKSAGLCLTSPEKYLLYCTSFLHDLGYFAAYSVRKVTNGLALLQRHGKMTAMLLQQKFTSEPGLLEKIIPTSYCPC